MREGENGKGWRMEGGKVTEGMGGTGQDIWDGQGEKGGRGGKGMRGLPRPPAKKHFNYLQSMLIVAKILLQNRRYFSGLFTRDFVPVKLHRSFPNSSQVFDFLVLYIYL